MGKAKFTRKLGLGAAAALAFTGAIAVPAAPAQAVANDMTLTTDSHHAGIARFVANGDQLIVCDMRRDGYSVGARVKWDYRAYAYNKSTPNVLDTTSNGQCRSHSFPQIPEKGTVMVEVWLYKNNDPYYLRWMGEKKYNA
ncbi:MAG: hypothetical protein JWN52_6118 [Actinomycetia bacterium]|jgi:hypothetical protein|nr:hypothetical protein [Actinomycetes bacterium]